MIIHNTSNLKLVEVMTRWHIVTDSKAKWFENSILNAASRAIDCVLFSSTFPIYVISRFASLHGIYRAVGRIRNILPRQEARTTQAKFRKIFESSSNIAELKIVGLPLFAFDDFRSCLRSVRIERLAVWVDNELEYPIVTDEKLRGKFQWVIFALFEFA